MLEKSMVAEHAWENHHLINWEESVLNRVRGRGELYCWRRPCTYRWHLQMSTSTGTDDWKSSVAGLHW